MNKPFDALRDRIDTENEWEQTKQKSSVPLAIWVKAKNFEGKGGWKLCRVNNGDPIPLRIINPNLISDIDGKSYSYFDVEYLSETPTDSNIFTREHVETIAKEAMYRVKTGEWTKFTDLIHFLNTNYPPSL